MEGGGWRVVEGGGWRVEGEGWWRVEGGWWRVEDLASFRIPQGPNHRLLLLARSNCVAILFAHWPKIRALPMLDAYACSEAGFDNVEFVPQNTLKTNCFGVKCVAGPRHDHVHKVPLCRDGNHLAPEPSTFADIPLFSRLVRTHEHVIVSPYWLHRFSAPIFIA